MPFIPHTPEDTAAMLAVIGAKTIDDLFDEIPRELMIDKLNNVPHGLSEMQATRYFDGLAKRDQAGLCFIGAGAYEHHIPAAVFEIATRGEFMTAYTPYQAEASQGTLQLLYEYQTMIASLMGLEVSNASLYDGATALAEAILMAVRANKHCKSRTVLLPESVSPFYRQVVTTIVQQQNITVKTLPFGADGRVILATNAAPCNEEFAALVIPQPNFFGVIEDVDTLTDWAHQKGGLVIAAVNPTAMALLKEPGAWGKQGADLACGEGQPLGIPLASGGPYFGFLSCRQTLVREMPGRIIGRTQDSQGREGFTLTLQAREQHIRRAKAKSNICTNQGLMVTAATIYLSLLGPTGLKRVALQSHANTQLLADKLCEIKGVTRAFATPIFHEVVLTLPCPVAGVLDALNARGIQGGFDLSGAYPQLGHALLICATETKTSDDLNEYQAALREILAQVKEGSKCL